MGIRMDKVPSAAEYHNILSKLCGQPVESASAWYLMWLVNDQAIGFSSLKNIKFGKRGDMHLHMWAAPMRGQGHGATLFCQSALEFYRLFQLKEIVCEPRAANPLPNRMLQKIGFPLLRTHVAASSELSEVCELNCYAISKDVSQTWLSKGPRI